MTVCSPAAVQLARVGQRRGVLFCRRRGPDRRRDRLLNLDTSVAFLTPVLIYTARAAAEARPPLLYGCLLLSNAGSLFLTGSNLTNDRCSLMRFRSSTLSGRGVHLPNVGTGIGALVVTAVVVAPSRVEPCGWTPGS